MLARWNAALAAAGPYLWDGKREDTAVTVREADGRRLRKYVWLLKDKALVFVVNLTEAERRVRLESPHPGVVARELLTGRPSDLSHPLSVPALDAVMVVLDR